MAVFELSGSPEHGPYSAVVGTDNDYRFGNVRIEPPFTPGSIVEVGLDDNINFEYMVSGSSSTQLFYELIEPSGESSINQKKVAELVGYLLEELAIAEDKQKFTEYWAKFEATRE
jgi:hypothetical protein